MPIFLMESGDVSAFDSVESAEGYVEAIDVEAGEYVAFDSVGRRLRMAVVHGVRWGRNVVISAAEDSSPEPGDEALRSGLLRYAVAVGPEISGILEPDSLTLEKLVIGIARIARV